MKQNKNYWFDFPGAVILYPILTIVSLIFYVGCDFIETDSIDHLNFTDSIVWYIFAVLGYIFCGMWGMIKGWWNGKFVIIGTMIILFSFLSFQNELYKLIPSYRDNILLVCTIVIAFCCVVRLLRIFRKNSSAILWVLPLLVILLYYVTKRAWLIIPGGLISMAILALVCTWHKSKIFRCIVTITTSVFYIASCLVYYQFNPLSSFQKIVNIGMSYPSRVTSLIVEKDGKYIIEDGLTMSKPVDLKFDCWSTIKPYRNAFVGFKANKFKEFECKSLDSIKKSIMLFPIVVKYGCAYFTSEVDTYKEIAKYKTLDNNVYKMTAIIFQDFMDLYQNNDSINHEKLKSHQRILQKEYTNLTTDSLVITKGVNNNEEFLIKLSKNLSLGIFNALCSDLVINNDINTALTIFSIQFYLTFIDSPIYKLINTPFNIDINRSYGITNVKWLTSDLMNPDTFQPWVKCLTFALSIAEMYSKSVIYENILTLARNINDENKSSIISISQYDKKPTFSIIENFRILRNKLSDYTLVPTIKNYAVDLQKFMYQCVSSYEFMPDYSSYFLNRFNQITPLVPGYIESEKLYKKMLSLYNERFDKDIKDVQEVKQYMDSINTKLELFQEKFEKILMY